METMYPMMPNKTTSRIKSRMKRSADLVLASVSRIRLWMGRGCEMGVVCKRWYARGPFDGLDEDGCGMYY